MSDGWRLVLVLAAALGVLGWVAVTAAMATVRLMKTLAKQRPVLAALVVWLWSRP